MVRPDICSVIMWHPNVNWLDSEVVLVKEFRSPASTNDGLIYELPGGSSFTHEVTITVTVDEVFEGTGFTLERQLMGTLSSHTASLTQQEIDWFKSQANIVHGNHVESEQTYVEVHTIRDILNNKLSDWSTLGQILSAIPH